MTFQGIDRQTVELKIDGYQFLHMSNDEYDDNWLNICLNVRSKLGDWQITDPCLTTTEMEETAKWLSNLADDKTEAATLDFIEPNLSFHLLDNQADVKKIRIKFDLECRPPQADNDIAYFVDCLFSNGELRQLSKDIINELAKFPKR